MDRPLPASSSGPARSSGRVTETSQLTVEVPSDCLPLSSDVEFPPLPTTSSTRSERPPTTKFSSYESENPSQRYDQGCIEKNCSVSLLNARQQDRLEVHSRSFPPAEGSTRQDMQPAYAQILKRPQDRGRKACLGVDLLVNHFRVEIVKKQKSIFHYHVKLHPPCFSKEVNRKLKSLLQEKFFGGEFIAYDGLENMYIADRTARSRTEFGSDPVQFHVCPWPRGRIYTMTLTKVKELSVDGLLDFLRGDRFVEVPRDYLQALDVAMRDSASWIYYPVNRSFYHDDWERVELDLNEGCRRLGANSSIWALPGFFESLRPVQRGLTLNLDSSAMAFHARKCVWHYLRGRGIDPENLGTQNDEIVNNASSKLAGLYVDVTHRTTSRRYKIIRLSEKPAESSIIYDNLYRRETNVIAYFREKYRRVRLKPSRRCLIVKGGGDPYKEQNASKDSSEGAETVLAVAKPEDKPPKYPCYLPIEVCLIAHGQKFAGIIPEDQKITLRSLAGKDPPERHKKINKNLKSFWNLLHEDGVSNPDKPTRRITPFGLEVDQRMISVTGQLIARPALMKDAREPPTPSRSSHPCEGWALSRVYKSGRKLLRHQLGIIGFGNSINTFKLKAMAHSIISRCHWMGMECFSQAQNPDYCFSLQLSVLENPDELEESLRSLQSRYFPQQDLERFIFCIFDDVAGAVKASYYGNLKRLCETQFGWLTQCCLAKRLEDVLESKKRHYLTNIALKVNAKLGGTNTALRDDFGTIFRSVFQNERVILFGADVTHPSPAQPQRPPRGTNNNVSENVGKQEVQPKAEPVNSRKPIPKRNAASMAAVVASMDWPHPSQYCARVRSQLENTEIIAELSAMVEELLQVHIKKNGGWLPRRAVFFRDGVSEGDFQNVLNREFKQLKQTLERRCPGLKVTWVVVQKRHHTRFFHKDGHGNVQTGTVVDTEVVHPWQWDFYLASQTTTRGTLRATHYHVLDDEDNFSPDDMHKFVYYLCYTFARCTKTVAVVPPVLYAHLAAYRGRAHYAISKEHNPTPQVINTMYFC